MKKYVPLIRQHEEKDCGAACLSMILQFHGKRIPLATVAEAIKVDQHGANIYGLLDGGKQFDLTGTAMEGTAEELVADVRSHTIQLPVIARIVNDNGFEHYIVLTGIWGGKVHFCDPGEGRRSLSYKDFGNCFLGQIVCFEKMGSFRKENQREGSVMEFVRLITRQKGLVAVVGVLSMLVTGISLLGTYLFQYLIDSVLPGIHADQMHSHEEFGEIEAFAVLVFAVGVLYVIRFLVQLLRGKLLTLMTKKINLPLLLGYYDHMVDLKMDFFGNHKTGDTISRFNDAGKVQEALSNVTLTLMIDIPLIVFCGFTLYRQSETLFLVIAAILVLYILISALYIRPLDKKNRQMMLENSKLNAYLKESVDGIETVKSFNAGTAVKSYTKELFCNLQTYGMKTAFLSMSKEALIELVTSVGTLCLLWVGVFSIASGEMTLGVFMTAYALLGYFLSPIQNVIELQSTLQSAVVAAGRLRDILDRSKEGMSIAGEESFFKNGNIKIEGVDFRYGNRSLVLKDMNMEIPQGSKAALIGPSGCGKTTITKLLLGFYQPECGHIRIGGKDLNDINLSDLRENIAYVPQDTFLFSDTIRQNLLLGNNRELTDEHIMRVLETCDCSFVSALPFGLHTMLEEHATNLSGGQRQRLAIARALLRDPKILVLDEATSNLDTISEQKLQQSLQRLYPNMTVIMVAHRLNSIRYCDQILVLNNGTLAEAGTHEELMEKNGLYTTMCNGMSM